MSVQEQAVGEAPSEQLGITQMLEARWAEGKFLCVGLDVVDDTEKASAFSLYERAEKIVDATKDVAAAFKPNSAFYERRTMLGMGQLKLVVDHIRKVAPGMPVIWDAKRGDIADGWNSTQQSLERLRVNVPLDTVYVL